MRQKSCESRVVVGWGTEAAIDEADEFDVAVETEAIVGFSEKILMENVFDAVFRQGEPRDENIVAA